MMRPISELFRNPGITTLIQDVDSAFLAHELGVREVVADTRRAVDRLRIAAISSFAALVNDQSLEGLFRQFASGFSLPVDEALESFRSWMGFLNALRDNSLVAELDDLLTMAAAGLIAERSSEVRSFLRHSEVRGWVDQAERRQSDNWADELRKQISAALLFLVRQETHTDVADAGEIIDRLSASQLAREPEWLAGRTNQHHDAAVLLALYHVAQATTRTSEFLLAGSVQSDGQLSTDIGVEVQRLLIRAEEYLESAGDLVDRYWLASAGLVLWRLRSDSIWVAGRGISERLDLLMNELVDAGRDRPVFSLLPSQQDALRQNLLDPTRTAVVLQMPTSAGKTLLAEFSIIQTMEAYKGKARVVYLVPTRALATQTRRTLTEDLGPLNIEVSAAGSAFEEDPFEMGLLRAAEGVVVATPEKLDLLLRAHPDWFETLRLVIVDEAHLLQDSERGVRLELLLANLRRERPQARLLLLTPFVQNAKQIAAWLGADRGAPITVHWRPAQLLLGLTRISGAGSNRALTIEWSDPYQPTRSINTLRIPTRVPSVAISTTTGKIIDLAKRFQPLGTVLALYSASRKGAETAARLVAEERDILSPESLTASLRVAIAIADDEFGESSTLGFCLRRGVAFHHSALSPMLRYLVEDQVRTGHIRFIAATTTLAQGMNFPVATVLVHSVHKPYGAGDLSSGEFWNIAGRAGRVGLVDKGLVVFTSEHASKLATYSNGLTDTIHSALLLALRKADLSVPLKQQYRDLPELRPFLQYLGHAAATSSPSTALAELEELLQGSLANIQVKDDDDARKMRAIARAYLVSIATKQPSYLHIADTTGLASFNFDELYAKINNDRLLRAGPQAILSSGEDGLAHLIEALRWLPELDLGIAVGAGAMDVGSVASVIQGWMDGKRVEELATEFPGSDSADQVRKASTYLHSTVSQTVSWGAHAYLRGWLMNSSVAAESEIEGGMLPAYIQYGVRTPEAVVSSLLGVPRQLAEGLGSVYRARFGTLVPDAVTRFRSFALGATAEDWTQALAGSTLQGKVRPGDISAIWRQMQGVSAGNPAAANSREPEV